MHILLPLMLKEAGLDVHQHPALSKAGMHPCKAEACCASNKRPRDVMLAPWLLMLRLAMLPAKSSWDRYAMADALSATPDSLHPDQPVGPEPIAAART